MRLEGLSLDQTPPLSVPAPYFLVAPIFVVAAGLVLVWEPALLTSRWSPAALAATHLVTLGFLALVMMGALQQLLPVLGGVRVSWARTVAWAIFLPVVIGTVALSAGLANGSGMLMRVASVLLGTGVGVFVFVSGWALVRSPSRHPSVRAMGAAISALAVTAALGLHLAAGHGAGAVLARVLTDIHVAWGGLGWVMVLVAGVAWQVVPMFQLTPDYPPWIMRALVPVTVAALLLWSATVLSAPEWRWMAGILGLIAAAFALVTLRLQQRRRRRLPDVTVDFWRLGMLSLIAAAVVWVGGAVTGYFFTPLIGLLFLVGFGVSVVSGMLYKIVPFLVWLHLNNHQFVNPTLRGRIPHMQQVIAESRRRFQFRVHLTAVLLLAGGALVPDHHGMVRVSGVVLAASALLLSLNLMTAFWRYGVLVRAPVSPEA